MTLAVRSMEYVYERDYKTGGPPSGFVKNMYAHYYDLDHW